MGTTVGQVSEIRRYPVKSMGGELLAEVELSSLGVAGDRRFAVRDIGTGKVISAKQPKLAGLLGCSAALDSGGLSVRVGDRSFALASRDELDTALSELLGRAVRLEAATGDDGVYESYWPEIDGLALSDVTTDFPIGMSTEKGTFVDLAALHVVTTASVDHLRSLAPSSKITMDRFRPSIVIEGGAEGSFGENDWSGRTARLGSATLSFTMAAPRCVMTTVAQGSLPRDNAVLQTLAAHNRIEFDGFGNFACLGAYAEVTAPGTVAVGDELVLE
jgi:uncharacterized protein